MLCRYEPKQPPSISMRPCKSCCKCLSNNRSSRKSKLRTYRAALWAFHDANDFREAVLRAVNLGDDADTTGAVCGQLAGAFWGESGIPQEWREGLARPEMIEKALHGLLGGEG